MTQSLGPENTRPYRAMRKLLTGPELSERKIFRNHFSRLTYKYRLKYIIIMPFIFGAYLILSDDYAWSILFGSFSILISILLLIKHA
jgi:hypothetical protein